MRHFPTISIVIPCFNYGKFLGRAIRSLVVQNYPYLQLIVVDGASTDCTLDVVNRYREHIDIFLSEPDRGQTDAINKGFELANGEIFNWLNADDELLPGSLYQIAAMWHEGFDMLIGKCNIIHELTGSAVVPQIYRPSYGQYFDFYRTSFLGNLSQPAVFLSKRIASKAFPLAADLRQVMDYQLYLRCLKHRPSIVLLDKCLANFYYHGSNMSTSDVPKLPELIKVCTDEVNLSCNPLQRWRLNLVLRRSILLQLSLKKGRARALCLLKGALESPVLFVSLKWHSNFLGSLLVLLRRTNF